MVYSLECNIRGGGGEDLKIDHLAQGMTLALEGDVELHSDVLGRNAVWRKTARVKKLPKYICIQYVGRNDEMNVLCNSVRWKE